MSGAGIYAGLLILVFTTAFLIGLEFSGAWSSVEVYQTVSPRIGDYWVYEGSIQDPQGRDDVREEYNISQPGQGYYMLEHYMYRGGRLYQYVYSRIYSNWTSDYIYTEYYDGDSVSSVEIIYHSPLPLIYHPNSAGERVSYESRFNMYDDSGSLIGTYIEKVSIHVKSSSNVVYKGRIIPVYVVEEITVIEDEDGNALIRANNTYYINNDFKMPFIVIHMEEIESTGEAMSETLTLTTYSLSPDPISNYPSTTTTTPAQTTTTTTVKTTTTSSTQTSSNQTTSKPPTGKTSATTGNTGSRETIGQAGGGYITEGSIADGGGEQGSSDKTPWYTTPVGLAGIGGLAGVASLAAVYMVAKKTHGGASPPQGSQPPQYPPRPPGGSGHDISVKNIQGSSPQSTRPQTIYNLPPGKKICPYCGAVIPAKARFCPKCGARLTA